MDLSVFASFTCTASPLGAGKLTVTVARVALLVFCEFTAAYWNVMVDALRQLGAHSGIAVKEPSAFKVTLPPAMLLRLLALSGSPDGSVSLPSTPGGLTCSRVVTT